MLQAGAANGALAIGYSLGLALLLIIDLVFRSVSVPCICHQTTHYRRCRPLQTGWTCIEYRNIPCENVVFQLTILYEQEKLIPHNLSKALEFEEIEDLKLARFRKQLGRSKGGKCSNRSCRSVRSEGASVVTPS